MDWPEADVVVSEPACLNVIALLVIALHRLYNTHAGQLPVFPFSAISLILMLALFAIPFQLLRSR